MIEWLIIGGGIHGTYLSNLLTAETDLSPDDVRVLDPHDRPLELWNRYARRCGMQYLRSPATHNIDIHILSLYRFAKSAADLDHRPFIPPYNRPSREVFQRHCDRVIRKRGLSRLRIKGRARAFVKISGGVEVETDNGSIQTRQVLLCIGQTEAPCWPDWARIARRDGGTISHVFDSEPLETVPPDAARTVVVGGGVTAVQTALSLIRSKDTPVVLLSPHDLRSSNFDFDPCWIGPKCMTDFLAADLERRRKWIDTARMPGTLPTEIYSEAAAAIKKGQIRLRKAGIRGVFFSNGSLRLDLDNGDIEADQIILATGFDPGRPAGALIDQASREFSLQTADNGYPVVDDYLRWGERIFFSGPLAELRIGPCARNIIGARNAGRLLLNYQNN